MGGRREVGGFEDAVGEDKVAVDVTSGLVVEGFAVVEVQVPLGVTGVVEHDREGQWVELHEPRAASWPVAAGGNMSCLHEQRDFVQGRRECDGLASADVGRVGEIVVVGFALWKVDINRFCALGDDGFCKQTCGAEVELVVERECSFVGWVDVVVGADDGSASGRGGVEGCIPCW